MTLRFANIRVSVHAIHDNDTQQLWFHSHGLRRFSCHSNACELELFTASGANPGATAQEHTVLMNVAVFAAIEQGFDAKQWLAPIFVSGPCERFAVDWVNEAHSDVDAKAPGGVDDRKTHVTAPSRRLLRLRTTSLADDVTDAQVTSLQPADTMLDEELVRDRFPLVMALQQATLGGHGDQDDEDDDKQDDDEDHNTQNTRGKAEFGAKVALETSTGAREHVWSTVHTVSRGRLHAQLASEPLKLSGLTLKEGDLFTVPLAQVTGLCVPLSPLGDFTIGNLVRMAPILDPSVQRQLHWMPNYKYRDESSFTTHLSPPTDPNKKPSP